ncbi:hypothetical protein RHSIM_Rhsim07G0056600 [Rhododendron simsii]|uniref:Uncharacterized protein n=1 Tax=Rhododendron simsii TaxID=118357 RepID=A0A834GY11_RHOSS|nr:hypothetical protein RHSIM_Rhsim07G0056600 [Rhododendron simsii]
MAALLTGHCFPCRSWSTQELKIKKCPRILFSIISCRRPIDPSNTETKKEKEKEKEKKGLLPKLIIVSVENFGKKLKDNLSPKQKGDWKDLMLMSLSFAVYVYMSQKIVCAYCAWTSMAKQPW